MLTHSRPQPRSRQDFNRVFDRSRPRDQFVFDDTDPKGLWTHLAAVGTIRVPLDRMYYAAMTVSLGHRPDRFRALYNDRRWALCEMRRNRA